MFALNVEEHDTKTCFTPATCALCNGNHPANYKGCTIYKDLINLRNTNITSSIAIPRINILNNNNSNTQTHQSHATYAQVAASKTSPQVNNNNLRPGK